MQHKLVSSLFLSAAVLVTPTISEAQTSVIIETGGEETKSKKFVVSRESGIMSPRVLNSSSIWFSTLSNFKSMDLSFKEERKAYDERNYQYLNAVLRPISLFDTDVDHSALFRRGTWEFTTMPYLEYRDWNFEDSASGSNFMLNLETHYFFRNRWGVGGEIRYDRNSSKNGFDAVSSDFTVFGHLTYGIPIRPTWGIYLRGGVGIGAGKTEITQGTNSQEFKSDRFAYKFEFGSPFHLSQNLYLNPKLSWGHDKQEFDVGEQKETTFRVGMGLVSYLNCSQEREHDDFDTSGMPIIRRNRYAPGVSYVGIHARTGYSTGKTDSQIGFQVANEDFSNLNLKFDYTYQVFQNFAIGADVGFRRMMTESQDSDFENTVTKFEFVPKIVFNLPTNNWSNDLFLTIGGGLGSRKNETVLFGNSNEQKDKITILTGGLGYNRFVTRSSLFTATLGYDFITEKDADNTDQKIETKGITFQLGFRTGLGIGGTN